ncbi:MAG: ribonuclease HII [Chloroflexi bacterium]|nr:ribonuclease HII [Chloroflexota bacterium]
MTPYRGAPTLGEELRAWRSGYRHVAGVDEVGRGPMAGPVVAGAVILDPQFAGEWWAELRDSKLISSAQRTELSRRLLGSAACSTGSASNDEIDDLGLIVATRLAMLRALEGLPCRPQLLLIDALTLPDVLAAEAGPAESAWEQRALIHGDTLSASIAAASIVAKVSRDSLMEEYDRQYPDYGFGQHKGYCTVDHIRALAEHGPCAVHRRSFAPVRAYLERGEA